MKYAIVVMDGAADRPLKALDGRTPMQAAETPNCDALADQGRVGLVRTVIEAEYPDAAVSAPVLMGADPSERYKARGPLEALAHDIHLEPRDRVWRCNFVTLADGAMADYSAGHITTGEARLLVDALNDELGGEGVEFVSGVSYRALLVLRDVGTLDIETAPPHDIYDRLVEPCQPRGDDARRLVDLMRRAADVLAAHDVNRVRLDMGENPATGIWPWGGGAAMTLPSFEELYGKKAAVISAVDLWRGVAAGMGVEAIEAPSATGSIDTDTASIGRMAVEALVDHDVVVAHVEAPDEATHTGQVTEKVRAIERVDGDIVGPLRETLGDGPHRILVAVGHAASCDTRGNLPDAAPFVIAGQEVQHISDLPFHERGARKSDLTIEEGYQLMEYFLRV